ncbi:MAG: sigma-54-dependent Fis family transcriptional regulator [Thermodesulfobacteriota bacterium]
MMKTNSSSINDFSGGSDSPSRVFPFLKKKEKAFNLFLKVQGAMHHVPNFVETCKEILDAVMEEIDAENCSVMLKDPVSGELSILASRGRNDRETGYALDPATETNRQKLKEGIAGWVLKEGQAVLIHDVKEEPRFIRADGLNNNVRSLICFPVREKDQVVGVFNLSHSKKGAFDEGDKLALAYISNQVGAALTSARFFMELQEMNRIKQEFRDASSSAGEEIKSSLQPSTFVEVGEIMERERGIFIYTSETMHQIKEMIDQVANTDVTVLIRGESGVGKEVVARSIHLNSLRRDKPFVKVNCAALPSELLESELFGYDKGAFTGAYRHKPGKFELANGGTIFLDEIVEISLPLQAKLLQVLQDREFSRLGGKKDVRVDVRVLAATNKNIEEFVTTGRFREDLYYRLNVVNITVPPLRDRKEEIPIFVEYFMDKFGKKYRKTVKPLSDEMMKIFLQHQWLGNVRELENVIQRIIVLGNEKVVLDELTSAISKESTRTEEGFRPTRKWPSLKEVHREAITKAEAEVIRKALEMTNWNRKKAASLLNISYKALLYKIKECGIGQQTIPQDL